MKPVEQRKRRQVLAKLFLMGEIGYANVSYRELVECYRTADYLPRPLTPLASAQLETATHLYLQALFSSPENRRRRAWRRYRARKGTAWDTARRARYKRTASRRSRAAEHRIRRKRKAYRMWWNARGRALAQARRLAARVRKTQSHAVQHETAPSLTNSHT